MDGRGSTPARRRRRPSAMPRTSPGWPSRPRARRIAAARRPSATRSFPTTGTSTPPRPGPSSAATPTSRWTSRPARAPARRIQARRGQIALLLCERRLPATAAASEEARALIDRHGGRRERNELRAFAAQLALCQGDLDAALRTNDGVYEQAIEHGEHLTAAYALWTHGTVERMRGNPGAAVDHFAAACGLVTELVDVCALDNLAAALAEAASAAGRADEAADACARTRATAPERPL